MNYVDPEEQRRATTLYKKGLFSQSFTRGTN